MGFQFLTGGRLTYVDICPPNLRTLATPMGPWVHTGCYRMLPRGGYRISPKGGWAPSDGMVLEYY